jgi:bifunctional oligoribonuclease and PAP phosphatase NrnA
MLTKIIEEKLVQKAKHLLLNSDNVALISHMGPDGDAVGSTLALADFLKVIGKNIKVIYPDAFPSFLSWMPGADECLFYEQDKDACESFLKKADLVVMIDFNQPKRMGELANIVTKMDAKKLLLDHHPDPEDFADVIISYPLFASSCEIVFRLICRGGFFDDITKECAECIYTGMMTDTGSFTFSSNNVEMYFIISQLIGKGIDKDDIYDKVFNTYSADRMRLMGFVLHEKMRIIEKYKTAIITLTKNDLDSFNYKVGDTEGFVNLPLSIEGIVFSVLLREEHDNIKLSFRSKGSFPVNKVAFELFNGGGHLNASGGEYYGKLEDAVKLLEKKLPDLMI